MRTTVYVYKVKFAVEQAMKAQRGVEVQLYPFFNVKRTVTPAGGTSC